MTIRFVLAARLEAAPLQRMRMDIRGDALLYPDTPARHE
jgi:hypothetical protein